MPEGCGGKPGFMKTGLTRWGWKAPVWVATALIAWCGCEARAQSQGALVGKPAPEFHVQGIYSEAYSLEPFKGHILVMQFGTSW
jgi:hypothetical protein